MRTAADLVANDRQWVEVHGVLATVQRTRPPKAHWTVKLELTDGTRLMPAVVGDVSPGAPLEGQPTRVVGLLTLCGTWIAQQVSSGHFLVDHDPPRALGEDLVVTATEAEREAAEHVVLTGDGGLGLPEMVALGELGAPLGLLRAILGGSELLAERGQLGGISFK